MAELFKKLCCPFTDTYFTEKNCSSYRSTDVTKEEYILLQEGKREREKEKHVGNSKSTHVHEWM